MQKIELNHVHYNDNEASLNAFTASFGQLDKIEGKGLEAQVMIKSDAGRTAEEVSDQVRAQLNKILNFKQMEQDRQYAEVKKKVKQEEEDRIAAEEAAAAAEQEAAAKQAEAGEPAEDGGNAEQDKSQAA